MLKNLEMEIAISSSELGNVRLRKTKHLILADSSRVRV
jgi:hypothetical protein